MLDIKFIRQNPDIVQTVAVQKGIELSVSELLRWDESKREYLKEVEMLRQSRNQMSKEINEQFQQGNSTQSERTKEKVKQVNIQLSEVVAKLEEVKQQYNKLMLLVPNVISPNTPIGRSDVDNVEVKPEFPKNYTKVTKVLLVIGDSLDLLLNVGCRIPYNNYPGIEDSYRIMQLVMMWQNASEKSYRIMQLAAIRRPL